MPPTATLKDVAAALGVTTTTVHRALHGKPGVSEQTRREVQEMAARLGYRANYMAATLKRKATRIAIVLPAPMGDSRYYYGNLWHGVRRFLGEVRGLNITPLEHPYPFAPGAADEALKAIFDNREGGVDGLLTIGAEHGQAPFYIEQLAKQGLPVVLVGSDLHPGHRLCCVRAHDEMAGQLAAELLTAFAPASPPKKIVVIGHFGKLGLGDQHHNAAGFAGYLQQHAPQTTLLQIRAEDDTQARQALAQTLRQHPDTDAIYSCSARCTIYAAEVLAQLGMAGRLRLIGNDCFAESLALLQGGTLSAIIDKKPARQSHLAMQILFNHIVKNESPPSDLLRLPPEVVLRSNAGKDLITGRLEEDTGENTYI